MDLVVLDTHHYVEKVSREPVVIPYSAQDLFIRAFLMPEHLSFGRCDLFQKPSCCFGSVHIDFQGHGGYEHAGRPLLLQSFSVQNRQADRAGPVLRIHAGKIE